jgi:cysteine desulfurase
MKIYLDNAATTKIDSKVLEKMNEANKKYYANPSSKHFFGIEAKEILNKARKEIAEFIHAEEDEIIFTSGGTESNNLAISGIAKANPTKKHIITSKIEHPAVLEVCRKLEKEGYKVDYISVDKEGIINLSELKEKISKNTLIVSVMHVNNEIGTIQPIEEIAKICKEKNVIFHTDAVQSFRKLNMDVKKINVDLMSVSAHKINGPKGVGFLYKRKEVLINPIIFGGGQEKNLRSGTENLSGIVGMAEAIKIKRNISKIKNSRDRMLKEILKIPGAKLNGSIDKRIYNNINVSFYGIEGESILLLLSEKGICVSTGSACSSSKLEHSHVLEAINVDEMYINGTIRITIDELNKKQEDYILKIIKNSVEKLREISPFKFKEVKNNGKSNKETCLRI